MISFFTFISLLQAQNVEYEWQEDTVDCWFNCYTVSFWDFFKQEAGLCEVSFRFERMFESREFQGFCGTGAYCCSGVNHKDGNGPVSNGDCPLDAVLAVTSVNHVCVRNGTIGN